MNHHAVIPLSSIKAAPVEGGELNFDYVAGPPKFGFNQIQVSGKDALKSFSEADLQAFAEAVNAELAKRV